MKTRSRTWSRGFRSLAFLSFAAVGFACSGAPSPESSIVWYVSASSGPPGDGSEESPFRTLAEVQEASGPGDIIYVVASAASDLIDGGIALKPRQRLLGIGPGGQPSAKVRVTNTTDHLEGVIVAASQGNEISNLHFVNMRNHAIEAVGGDLSGIYVHDSQFEGAAESDAIIWSVRLESDRGNTMNVRVTDSEFGSGHDLGGIQVYHRGESSGAYLFERNTFSDLGGRAYHLLSEDSSKIRTDIRDSSADNIGLGDRNSDSILPHLRNQSEQTVSVTNYHFNNTEQVGSPSNTGLEAFLEGAPFPDSEAWCDGCRLTLRIVSSIFENSVTDGIQLINFGSNSELDVEIRGTKILGAKPQQVGGGISLLSQNAENSGNRSMLLVEDTDVINSSQFGIAISDVGEGYTSVVDLGGGELGSAGNNRIIGSQSGEIRAINANPVAMNNWWGGSPPRVELSGVRSTFTGEPMLSTDPRSR